METLEYIRRLIALKETCPKETSWIRITTITMMARKVTGNMDPQKVREKLKQLGDIQVRQKDSGRVYTWKRIKSKRGVSFYNSVSIGYTDENSTKHVKLFTNGSVHVTGCSNLEDCKRVAKQLMVVLPKILDEEIECDYSRFEIVMMNTSFSMNVNLNLYKLVRHFATLPDVDIKYDPGVYAAAMIKYKPEGCSKKITANIFSTGNVIIAGAQNLGQVLEMYKMINEKIPDEVKMKPVEVPRTFDRFMGCSFKDWKKYIQCN